MSNHSISRTSPARLERVRDYYELCKPRVVMLIVFTAVVGMFLAAPGLVAWQPLVFATLGITLAAASAAAVNQMVETKIDARMARTNRRPLVTGSLGMPEAMAFAALLGVAGEVMLYWLVNPLTALLTLLSLLGYAVVYTIFLKRSTSQNIVLGGAAGAAPPILGWTAVTAHVTLEPLLLFLIIFIWTPPHFWALAIDKYKEYAAVDMPMLPVTHGLAHTRTEVLLYTIALVPVSLSPFFIGMSGWLYLAGAVVLDAVFVYYAVKLKFAPRPGLGMKTFGYSIIYLLALFSFLLLDHYVKFLVGY